MDLELKGKTAFISGATQGIGYAIARQLLKEGVAVTINGRDAAKTAAAVQQLQQEFPGEEVQGIAADFSDPISVDALLQQLPAVDILINNVGVFELKAFEATGVADWYRMFDVNVMSGVRLSQQLLPKMLEKNWGRIVFISSEAGVNIPGDMIHYGMSKAAMMAVSNGLSKLTKGTAVTVNTVLGGPTYSEGVAQTVEAIAAAQDMEVAQLKSSIVQQTNPHSLLQRFIQPSEIASLAVYLCSPLAVATNGASLRADGGVLRTV
jgi:NAD(P)-dependent dehydrogenase (short-subunit alcohol dehydrogenase family)